VPGKLIATAGIYIPPWFLGSILVLLVHSSEFKTGGQNSALQFRLRFTNVRGVISASPSVLPVGLYGCEPLSLVQRKRTNWMDYSSVKS